MEDKIKRAKIIACCGSGGVGKTTLSATIGLFGALMGKKTIVLTIDPAKRLADALGLESINYDEQRVPESCFDTIGRRPKASLYAMMLDTRHVFDRVVTTYSSSPEMTQNILNNRYYQYLSTSLAGTHEYMAMEKLYELNEQGKYDLIVLDTPPSRRALDFLDAPDRLNDLFGKHFFWNLLKPYFKAGKLGYRMIYFVASPVLRSLSKIFGIQALNDLADFFYLADDSFIDGFRNRSQAIKSVLASPETLFLAITSPLRAPMLEALYFYDKIKENNMPFGGFIINRVHKELPKLSDSDRDAIHAWVSSELLAKKITHNYHRFERLGASCRQLIENLMSITDPTINIYQIPFFDSDVHDFAHLYRLHAYLCD
ncbi:MAG: anion-transporting ATPase [Candidatus Magnetoglobus multicellularis str. Araruama]|uniref:arsenite-transporting ATPase n=1 Tax=Candidatus Magnetoglobus multicellularis str. Araruama TaxID=890399 RepID=A0A1V1PAK8_9BACT|nr:MAG: anion-transporting ATPase [Candidatus Magnetoglobus multicellularis str. Araruama]